MKRQWRESSQFKSSRASSFLCVIRVAILLQSQLTSLLNSYVFFPLIFSFVMFPVTFVQLSTSVKVSDPPFKNHDPIRLELTTFLSCITMRSWSSTSSSLWDIVRRKLSSFSARRWHDEDFEGVQFFSDMSVIVESTITCLTIHDFQ